MPSYVFMAGFAIGALLVFPAFFVGVVMGAMAEQKGHRKLQAYEKDKELRDKWLDVPSRN